ncbi:(2Fe-2S)-binding protein [Leptolyngbya sp. BL0902]|uniref:Rieske 2Fe-2S domain-containing protein n=1 Tax=Leptolyngbya sp. BL0902 TaxID=1115757 RepID=UPI001935830E|nr:Rieske 2Fe-2S domain-containing protein [Leptolyngbya sp. BL0902]QQE66927.1 (2Fe-2S)-binding protein [Leptolyngbya sp. BL0902]
MPHPTGPQEQRQPPASRRRSFLKYLVGGSMGAIALGLLRPNDGSAQDLEQLCSTFPHNSRCQDYLPGVPALDVDGTPLAVDTWLPSTTPGEPVAVTGIPNQITYLVILDGPSLAPYGLNPRCPHLGCTVDWNTDQQRFICPCHGSQFDGVGQVVRGPANQPLPLVTVIERQNQVRLVAQAPILDPR